MKILPCLAAAFAAIPAIAQTPSLPATLWLGIGQDWSLGSNWSAGLPSASTSAVFNLPVGSSGTIANINGDAYVKDLYFYDGFALGSIGYKNGAVDVQIGRAASTNPMFAEISIGGDLNISGNSSGSVKVSMASDTVNIGGVVNIAASNSTFAVLRATLNNPEYLSNQKWGGLTGSGIVMVEAATWTGMAKYDSVFTANITLANKSDQTFTGQVKYVNITDGGYSNTSAINLAMDAENSSATQTITLGGSAGFTTVSVKNCTLQYSAPAASV